MEQDIVDVPLSSPILNSVETKDYALSLSWGIESLRYSAMQLNLPRPRSLAWAILLQVIPPPSDDIIKCLKTHRNFYNDLKSKLSMDPRAVVGDDPLSQNDESAWKQHFCDNELQALILQDVVRTFPDEPYFRDSKVQNLMVSVLFFWARSHTVGYRQGMHEVLAPLLLELYIDRKHAPTALCNTLKCFLDEAYLEHDSYMLFSAVMKGLEKFYTTGDAVPSPSGRLPPSRHIHSPNEVVRYLERIREEHLVSLDLELATHLDRCNITMELFGIRWVRLLFGREFIRSDLPQLWSFIFADGPLLPHLHYMVLALLLALRTLLLDPDPGCVLSALMRPSAVPVTHVCALALHLRDPLLHPRPSPYHFHDTTNHNSSGDSPAGRSAERAGWELAALLQCRNHALIDVETALEAAEGQDTDKVGKRQLVPVSMIGGRRVASRQPPPKPVKLKEVQLKVFHQTECNASTSDLPCLDPLKLRTE
ncbi:TBC1 domain family member 5 isoform X3 [Pectinophora gossypiella]|uniref:TBC1 domain family member 5 isoform X3 n=1 Tax=Pectinophora gossypiella TaxID=13191 RepID=UPI00214E730C|nr:TBC1 domain family member 5 isoform X3 [Pectinophora gossypiella]